MSLQWVSGVHGDCVWLMAGHKCCLRDDGSYDWPPRTSWQARKYSRLRSLGPSDIRADSVIRSVDWMACDERSRSLFASSLTFMKNARFFLTAALNRKRSSEWLVSQSRTD